MVQRVLFHNLPFQKRQYTFVVSTSQIYVTRSKDLFREFPLLCVYSTYLLLSMFECECIALHFESEIISHYPQKVKFYGLQF